MFQFPGFAPHFGGVPESPPAGCPIRKSAARRVFAPDRGLSQLITSFIASESQGILHVPLSPFLRILVTTSCGLFIIRTRRSLVSMSFEFCLLVYSDTRLRSRIVASSMSMSSFLCRGQAATVVENNGFEPLTPCLQSRCSSQLS